MGEIRLLLVEGKDDQHVIGHLLEARELKLGLGFFACEGIGHLLEHLPVRLKPGGDLDSLGVVVDADTNLAARWDSVRNRLENAGYAGVPRSPAPEGTIVDPPDGTLLPRVGVWIMPDNRAVGMLEDFLQLLVPEGSLLLPHAEASIDGIPKGEQRFNEAKRTKALIHTWLAWQEEPGTRLGTAIKAKYLDPASPSADGFVAWMQRLFIS